MTAYLVRMRSGCEGGGKGALVQTEKSGTLATNNDQTLFVVENKCYRICSEASNSMKSKNPHSGIYETELSPTIDTTVPTPSKGQGGVCVVAIAGNTIGRKPENGGNGDGFETDGKMYTLTATDVHGVVYENHAQDARYEEKSECPTITSRYGTGGGNVPLVLMDQGGSQMSIEEDMTGTLRAQEHGHQPIVLPINTQAIAERKGDTGNRVGLGIGKEGDPSNTLGANHCHGVFSNSQVRRLTPVECERLQGFPDGYTDFKEKTPDGPRYKALGNSWAVPVVKWLGKRIDDFLEGRLE